MARNLSQQASALCCHPQMRRGSRGTGRYLDFYNGNQWEGLPAPNERRLTFNYARVFINKAASYLMGKGVSFAVDPPGGSGEHGKEIAQHAEALLQTAYERNSLALVDLDTAVDSAVLGDGAFKVTWDPIGQTPVVTAVDPAGLVCERQPDDYRTLAQGHAYLLLRSRR